MFSRNFQKLVATTLFLPLLASAHEFTPLKNAVPDIEPGQKLVLLLPKSGKVIFHGEVGNLPNSVNSHQMLYPAVGGVGGFLAAVLTHGLLVHAGRTSLESQQREEAEKAVNPYQSILNTYSTEELMQRSLGKITHYQHKQIARIHDGEAAHRLLESTPIFYISQDHSTIILENIVMVHKPGTPEAVPSKCVIKVVSRPQEGPEPTERWIANQGEQLKAESADLLAESFNLALSSITDESSYANNAYKTVRYHEGDTEKMVRGQLITESCERVIVKTLRGIFLSAPRRCQQ